MHGSPALSPLGNPAPVFGSMGPSLPLPASGSTSFLGGLGPGLTSMDNPAAQIYRHSPLHSSPLSHLEVAPGALAPHFHHAANGPSPLYADNTNQQRHQPQTLGGPIGSRTDAMNNMGDRAWSDAHRAQRNAAATTATYGQQGFLPQPFG